MYLKGSRLSLNKKRHKPNGWLIALLILGIGVLLYFNLVVVPVMNPPFVPTPTPTREPASYVKEADQLATEGKYIQAVEVYQSAINANPQDIQNYLKIARLQIYINQLEQAQVNAQNAILLDNTSAEAFALLGWTKGFQKEYLAGEVDIQKRLS